MNLRHLISITVLVVVPAGFLAAEECAPQPPSAGVPAPEKKRGGDKKAFPQKNCRDAVPPPDGDDLPPPPGAFSKEEARLLKSLLSMSDAELKRLRGFIQHLERMPPEKRRQMARDLERAAADMTPEERAAYTKELRERFRKNQENLLARYYATLPQEQADAERKKFLSLDHKGRRLYIFEVRKKLGCPIPPPPPPEQGGGEKEPPRPDDADGVPAAEKKQSD